MFTRIVIGVLIGLAAGLFFEGRPKMAPRTIQMVQGFIGVIAIAFIASSFMFGGIYGAMAIGEIAAGFFIFSKMVKPKVLD